MQRPKQEIKAWKRQRPYRPSMNRPLLPPDEMEAALARIDDLSMDIIARLCLAYPKTVPYGRTQRLLDGRWADEMTAGAGICVLRRQLGSSSIITARRKRKRPVVGGYAASDALYRAWQTSATSPAQRYVLAGRILTSGTPMDAIRACDDLNVHPHVRELVDRGLRDADMGRLLALAVKADLVGGWRGGRVDGTTTSTTLPHGAGGSSPDRDRSGSV